MCVCASCLFLETCCSGINLPAEREEVLEVHFSCDFVYKFILLKEQNLLIEGFICQVLLETKHREYSFSGCVEYSEIICLLVLKSFS